MEFKEYQIKSRKTAVYPDLGSNFIYPTLGLAGETGEVVEKIKKAIRDDGGNMSEDRREEIKKELGDVLWYLANLSTELGIDFNDVAEANIEKLYSRMERDAVHGEGDNR